MFPDLVFFSFFDKKISDKLFKKGKILMTKKIERASFEKTIEEIFFASKIKNLGKKFLHPK